ncbi:hypothetical protein J19TS2_18090 [Cohnella xylanilytica]|nr:hypothetical protein J19TS2_18090 [Cohnella xylanilytica]
MYLFAVLNVRSGKKNNLIKSIVIGFLFVFLAIYIGDIRDHQFNPLVSLSQLTIKILYGNNFSDLRDFAWVLSGWDKEFLYGKTELAGIMSFIPSSVSSLRDEWGLGEVTTRIIGYSSDTHPGLRPGIFGEAFLNFGYVGVVSFGFIYGFAIYKLHRFAQDSLSENDRKDSLKNVLAAQVLCNMLINVMITAGFFSFYIMLFLIFVGFLLFKRKYHQRINLNNPSRR